VWLREQSSDYYTFHEVIVKRVYGCVCDAVESANCIVDLGANIGLTTVFFAGRYPSARIFAVEPDSRNFAMLRRNTLGLETTGRLRPWRAALWESDAVINIGSVPGGCQFNAIRVGVATCESAGVVQGMTMKTIKDVAQFQNIDILKVDVEGAEVGMFRGELDWLGRTRVLAIEFHGDSRRESNFDAVMREHGFEVSEAPAHTTVAINQAWPPR
jgi:FkbM family methyltransferase